MTRLDPAREAAVTTTRPDYEADARRWLRYAEELYKTSGDSTSDIQAGTLAAAIGQAYATLELAYATRAAANHAGGAL